MNAPNGRLKTAAPASSGRGGAYTGDAQASALLRIIETGMRVSAVALAAGFGLVFGVIALAA